MNALREASPRRVMFLSMTGAVVFYALFIARNAISFHHTIYFTLFDDAMVSMRYAHNLANGFGLVWNPGQPPVEGFTNPLWTAWMTVLHLLPIPAGWVPLAVSLTGAACVMGTALVARRIALAISPGATSAANATFLLTAFYFPLVYWSLRGMEVGTLALLIAAATLAGMRLIESYHRRRAWSLAVLLGVAQLVRPDAIVAAIAVVAYTAARLRGKERTHLLLACALVLGIVIAGTTALRLWYYGDLLPNTYYLKVAGASPIERVSLGLSMFVKAIAVHFWFFLGALCVSIVAGWPRNHRGTMLPVFVLLGQCVYSIWVGGDFEEHLEMANRYLSIAVPGALALVCVRISEIELTGRETRAALVGLGIAGAVMWAVTRRAALLYERIWLLSWHEYQALAVCCALVIGIIVLVARMGRSGVPAVLLLLALFLSMDGYSLFDWTMHGAPVADDDARLTLLGIELKQRANKDTVIAVVYAGSTPYWSELPSVDLLGKSDRFIAHGPNTGRFRPGHSKWNYRYSLTTYHPDAILQTWRLTRADREFFAQEGYRLAENGMYLKDSALVSGAGLDHIYPRMIHLGGQPE